MSESEPWSAQNLGKLQAEVYDMSESEPWNAQNLGKLQVEVYDMSEGYALEFAKPADSKQRFTTCRKASLGVRKTSRLQAEVYDMSESEP